VALEDQQCVLLKLVFDPAFRAAFLLDPDGALAPLPLTDDERRDFVEVNRFGVQVDARERDGLVVGRLVASYPLTVSALSAFAPGLECLGPLVGPQLFEAPAHVRPLQFGRGLLALVEEHLPAGPEQSLTMALGQWELALAQGSSAVRALALSGELTSAEAPTVLEGDWAGVGLALAPFMAVAQLPMATAELTRLLCPCAPDKLYERLRRASLPKARLTELARAQGHGRLVLGRAVLKEASRCDAMVTHRVMEVAPGFAPLLGHLDGGQSLRTLLSGLSKAGAPDSVLEGFQDALEQLVTEGFLTLVPPSGRPGANH